MRKRNPGCLLGQVSGLSRKRCPVVVGDRSRDDESFDPRRGGAGVCRKKSRGALEMTVQVAWPGERDDHHHDRRRVERDHAALAIASRAAKRADCVGKDRQPIDVEKILADAFVRLPRLSNSEEDRLRHSREVVRANSPTGLQRNQVIDVNHRVDLIQPFALKRPTEPRLGRTGTRSSRSLRRFRV